MTKGNGYFGKIIQILLEAERSFHSAREAAHEGIRLRNEERCPKVRRKTDGIHEGLALRQVCLFTRAQGVFQKGVNEDTSEANAAPRAGMLQEGASERCKKAETKEETDLQETIPKTEWANMTNELGGREVTRAWPQAIGDHSEEGKHALPPIRDTDPSAILPLASSPQSHNMLQNAVLPSYSLYSSLDCRGRKAPASPTAPGQCQHRSRDRLPQKLLFQAASPASSSQVPAGLQERGEG